jgi:hypothetical protein
MLVPKGTDLLIFVFVVLCSFTSVGYNTNHYCRPARRSRNIGKNTLIT